MGARAGAQYLISRAGANPNNARVRARINIGRKKRRRPGRMPGRRRLIVLIGGRWGLLCLAGHPLPRGLKEPGLHGLPSRRSGGPNCRPLRLVWLDLEHIQLGVVGAVTRGLFGCNCHFIPPLIPPIVSHFEAWHHAKITQKPSRLFVQIVESVVPCCQHQRGRPPPPATTGGNNHEKDNADSQNPEPL